MPIGLIIASQVGYQLAQRAMPAGANPFAAIAVAYVLGIAACVALAPLVGRPIGIADSGLVRHWPIWALAASVVGIELGYLLAYRAGWTLATTTGVGYRQRSFWSPSSAQRISRRPYQPVAPPGLSWRSVRFGC